MTVNFPTRPGMQLAAAVVFLVGYVTSASAQSLGDVARREAGAPSAGDVRQGVHERQSRTRRSSLDTSASGAGRAFGAIGR